MDAPAANALADVSQWREETIGQSRFSCDPIPFDASREWRFDHGRLTHRTGGFFAVAGLVAEARCRDLDGREQLILLQPDPAINGFLMQRTARGPALLFQGRVEPGNVGIVQLAPTVQSTPANYKRLHGGGATPFIEWFGVAHAGTTVVDQMQSEEGTRYHGKYNRNVVVALPEDVEPDLPANFRWCDLPALRALSVSDNLLNTDARSVLAAMPWGRLSQEGHPFSGHAPGTFGAALRDSYRACGDLGARTLRWLAQRRVGCALRTRVVPLTALRYWRVGAHEIRDERRAAGFSLRQFRITAHGREVPEWDQPLIDSHGDGRVVLLSQQRAGGLHFLVTASHEIGFLEGVQLTASLCVSPGQTLETAGRLGQEIARRVDRRDAATVHAEFRQSEEGGRFYQDEHAYQIVEIDEGIALPATDRSRWVTLGELRQLVRVPGALTIELRSALSALLSWL